MHYFLIIFNFIITSLFLFPFQFKFLPGINTKMMLAALGLVILALRLLKERTGSIRSDLFKVFIFAGIVSLIGLISITVNNTQDTAYAGYIVSMAVWLSGAFTVVSLMRYTHGNVNISILFRYIIAVSVMQCVMAMVIDYNPAVKALVDSVIEQGQDFLNDGKVHRLYGIGASLDVAGSRFAVVLVAIIYLLMNEKNTTKYQDAAYLLSFAVIAVIGNIIARTTTVGLLVALAYLACMMLIGNRNTDPQKRKRLLGEVTVMLCVAIPVVVFFYNHNASFHNQIQFGFEGFFSIFESGEWQTSSNDHLKTMIHWPETFKTWVIGDGYFSSPWSDPNYLGDVEGAYYMNTDIGYLRFIFYFGLIGLGAFCLFFFESTLVCMKNFPKNKVLFTLVLLIGLIVWMKVATDIFLFFALFLAMDPEKEDEDEAEEADAQITEG